MWGKRLAAMLAIYTGRGVAPEVNLRERIYHVCLCQVRIRLPTLALKPRGDVTRSPKQGYQWPQKWACVQQTPLKKKSVNAWDGPQPPRRELPHSLGWDTHPPAKCMLSRYPHIKYLHRSITM